MRACAEHNIVFFSTRRAESEKAANSGKIEAKGAKDDKDKARAASRKNIKGRRGSDEDGDGLRDAEAPHMAG